MRISNLSALIGGTPLIRLSNFAPGVRLWAKAEFCNPGGSAKDRVARAMLDTAEAEGLLTPGATVIEPTSGNTGIALAMLCAARGYECVIVMPDSMSRERRLLMEAYGARVILTPGEAGMAGAVAKAEELARQIPRSWIPDQFHNPANPAAHYATTGPEIWADSGGTVDILVAGIGTGGTLTGAGRYLRERNPALGIVGVEPAASPLLSRGYAGAHGIPGLGANFIPAVLDRALLDEIITVTDAQAREAAQTLARREGILAGISSGAALYAALTLARRPENRDRNVVAILPDTGRNDLSSAI